MLVAGNWKMHGSAEFIREWLAQWGSVRGEIPASVEVALFPPFPFLGMLAAEMHKNGGGKGWVGVGVGGQDCSAESVGARTGEVSAGMLAEFGCKYALIGHSERRRFWGEDGAVCGAKMRAATEVGLTPILCVGETAAERKSGKTEKVVREQLHSAMREFRRNPPDGENGTGGKRLILGYEPVWAIGSGEIPSAREISEAHRAIRDFFGEMRFEAGECDIIQVIYGGSVGAANAAEIFAAAGVDGALVGGASLRALDFARICRAAGMQNQTENTTEEQNR